MDQDMVRWIIASCRAFFFNRRQGYTLFFENIGAKNLKDTSGKEVPYYAEFRVDGPGVRQLTKREYVWEIEINVLLHGAVDVRYSDEIEKMLGVFAAAFEDAIPVYRYGDGVRDDQSQIGCLRLFSEKGEEVQVSRFGQANPDTKLTQASVDGRYRMRQTL